VASFLEKILRTGDKKILRQLEAYSAAVDSLEDSFASMTDAELRGETDKFRARIEDGESLDIMLPEAFAVVREASKRTLGKRHYKVQVMGGAALHLGNIAEMKTGEGKTLVATLPAYLNALSGKGVHVVTVNDYLAEYQANLMGRVYRFLGMESGVILSSMDPDQRRKQYEADITYGTNNEFGFDYLRDNMAWTVDEQVQRGHNFAIIAAVIGLLANIVCARVMHDKNGMTDYNSHAVYLHLLSDILSKAGIVVGIVCAMLWDILWIDAAVAIISALIAAHWAKNLLWETGRILTRKENQE